MELLFDVYNKQQDIIKKGVVKKDEKCLKRTKHRREQPCQLQRKSQMGIEMRRKNKYSGWGGKAAANKMCVLGEDKVTRK